MLFERGAVFSVARIFGGGKLAERNRVDAYARGDTAGAALGRLENMQARFRGKNAMGAEAADEQYRVFGRP
jgi:hypothetical protein